MATFFFRAVASDGKMRTGSLAGDNDKTVVRELRKQGLTPVYVGASPKGSSIEIKLPVFGGNRRRDVLFFTQELSTLLNAGVPLDRSLSITAELTEHRSFKLIVLDVLRVLKGGGRWPTAWPRIPNISPTCISTWCAPEKLRARWR
jgi:general secretion pathway protein F